MLDFTGLTEVVHTPRCRRRIYRCTRGDSLVKMYTWMCTRGGVRVAVYAWRLYAWRWCMQSGQTVKDKNSASYEGDVQRNAGVLGVGVCVWMEVPTNGMQSQAGPVFSHHTTITTRLNSSVFKPFTTNST